MKNTYYPAAITWTETDKVFEVAFPDLSGCIPMGLRSKKQGRGRVRLSREFLNQ